MTETVVIDPVTRIEGHGKITIELDERGYVADARFHVTQLRGFETFCQGRPFAEMPSLMARICGICPVSHLIASAKACDQVMAVTIPPTASKLRRIMNLAQIVQSHALSFFHLSSPDLLLGMDADPDQRNLFALAGHHPGIVREGIALRKLGQEVIEMLGGRRIHPAWIVPGGVASPLEGGQRDAIAARIPEQIRVVQRTLDWFKNLLDGFSDEIRSFANFPSFFMGLVDEDGGLEHYDGRLRVVDATGATVVDDIDPARYREVIGETTEPWTYLKFPYLLSKGYPDGMYRVGPLARLNVIDTCHTPWADQELSEFRELGHGAVHSSFHFHFARLIEILFCLERMQQILDDPDILDPRVRAHADANSAEGIGVAEAPRGLLIHHYRVDRQGLIEDANLIIATGHNNLAMNRGVFQVAKRFIRDGRLDDGILNRVEAVIRAFDPCLSCSTHAVGRMPLELRLVDAGGREIDRRVRDAE
ncbi:MAG TPA: Ni/Fe hydrogenase subunit alpha [Candidatus Sulfomarinibacteraceae bacterium]|nr:Ni/Fe hydrogenase subunit alpha [Candidatus Sulfomarinibacteraceae bacterium]